MFGSMVLLYSTVNVDPVDQCLHTVQDANYHVRMPTLHSEDRFKVCTIKYCEHHI